MLLLLVPVLTCVPLSLRRVTVLVPLLFLSGLPPLSIELPVVPRVVAPPERVEVVLRVTWELPVLLGVLEERVIVLGLLTVEVERSLDDLLT